MDQPAPSSISSLDDADPLDANPQQPNDSPDEASGRSMASGRGFRDDVDSAVTAPSTSSVPFDASAALTTIHGWSIRPLSTLGSTERTNKWLMSVLREAYNE